MKTLSGISSIAATAQQPAVTGNEMCCAWHLHGTRQCELHKGHSGPHKVLEPTLSTNPWPKGSNLHEEYERKWGKQLA